MNIKPQKLSCVEARSFIKQYLLEEMQVKEAEQFVKHMRSCKECRIELEEYYAFYSALMQLDTKDDLEKGNFFINIEKRLDRTEAFILKTKMNHNKRRVVYLLIAILLAATMGVSIV